MAWPREVRLQHNSQQKLQCEMGLRGVTHSRIEENHKVHHQEILHNVALLKNQSEQLPEPPSSPRSWKKCSKTYKTERFPSRVLWRETKGIWEKEGQTWKVGKTTIAMSQVENYFVRFPKGRSYSRGIGDTLHFSKTKVSSCQLKKTNIYKHWMLSLSHSFPPRVLWKEMKGMWEK